MILGQERLMTRQIVASLLLTSLALTTGCTSMKRIQTTPGPARPEALAIRAGDTVELRLTDGRTTRFVVRAIEEDAIIGAGGERVPLSEIVVVKKKSFNGPKTALLVGGILAGVYVVLSAAAASLLLDNLG
jgi:hypothetical protein